MTPVKSPLSKQIESSPILFKVIISFFNEFSFMTLVRKSSSLSKYSGFPSTKFLPSNVGDHRWRDSKFLFAVWILSYPHGLFLYRSTDEQWNACKNIRTFLFILFETSVYAEAKELAKESANFAFISIDIKLIKQANYLGNSRRVRSTMGTLLI